MLDFDPDGPAGAGRGNGRFFLYVEGPRDRDILQGWAYRLLPSASRRLFDDAVILGGRRPKRAVEHFLRAGGTRTGARALCVLDRDDGGDEPEDEPGVEFFTWTRRHIESYLLVPDALRRALWRREENGRLDRALRIHLPSGDDESVWREIDAKRLLSPKGEFARALGRPLPLGHIARATREAELHRDVHDLFERLRGGLGVPDLPQVVR